MCSARGPPQMRRPLNALRRPEEPDAESALLGPPTGRVLPREPLKHLAAAPHDVKGVFADGAKNLRAREESDADRKERKGLAVRSDQGDSFSPLNDHSRLSKRNDYVRYFGDRKKHVFMRQLFWALEAIVENESQHVMVPVNDVKPQQLPDVFREEFKRLRGAELTPLDTRYEDFVRKWLVGEKALVSKDQLNRAYDAVKYRPFTGAKYVARVAWIWLSGFGTVNKAWAALTSASYTVVITVVTSYLLQAQTEEAKFVSGASNTAWADATQFVYNAFQMGLLVLGMLTAVQMINYAGYCWKSHGRILREARFAYIMDRYREQDPTMYDFTLDYNPDCDPDVAMMYFTLREERNARGGWFGSALGRLGELCSLRVDEGLLFDKLLGEGKMI